MPFPFILIPIAAAILWACKDDDEESSTTSSGPSSGSSSGGTGEYNGPDYPDGPEAYSGRWTQNDLAVRENIAMGMAIKEDD